jgi:hypothetical protein
MKSATQTIEDFLDASITRSVPGAGVPRRWWGDAPRGSQYDILAHQDAIEEELDWKAEQAALEARRVDLEDRIQKALQGGDRKTARSLMAAHYCVGMGPDWCGDPYCCS